MMKCNRRFNASVVMMIASFGIVLAMLSMRVNKYYSLLADNELHITNANISRSLSKLLLYSAANKYSIELMINVDKNNDYLRGVAAEYKEKRIAVFTELAKLLKNGNLDHLVAIAPDISGLEEKLSKLFTSADEEALNLGNGFVTSEWSKDLNFLIDEIEKMADVFATKLEYKHILLTNTVKMLIDCYRQIFVLTMYANVGKNIDELGRLLFFSYERNINMYWKKIESILKINKLDCKFLEDFKANYFGSFVQFKDAFLKSNINNFTDLFLKFEKIIADFDKFCYSITDEGSFVFDPNLVSVENITFAVLLMFLMIGIILTLSRKKTGPQFVINGVSIGNHAKSEPVVPIANVNNFIDVKKEIVSVISDNIKDKAIENHKKLNQSYEDLLANINKFKEKVNTITYKNNKFQEVVSAGLLRLDKQNLNKDFVAAGMALGSLQEIKSCIEKWSYKDIEDMAVELEASSYKIETVKNVSTEIFDKIRNLSVQSVMYEGALDNENFTKDIDKLAMMASAKSDSIKKYIGEANTINASAINTLRCINNSLSSAKSAIQKVSLCDVDTTDMPSNFDKYTNNAEFLKTAMQEHINGCGEILGQICGTVVSFKETIINMINSVSSFKENIINDLESDLLIVNDTTEQSNITAESQSLSTSNKVIRAQIFADNRRNRFFGKAASISMHGAVVDVSESDINEHVTTGLDDVEVEFNDFNNPIRCNIAGQEQDKLILEFKELSSEQRNCLKLLI